MDIVRKVVLFVLVLVIGIMLITVLIPPFADTILERADVAQYSGLDGFTRLLPLLATLGLVLGGLLLLFRSARRREYADTPPGLPPGYTRRPRLPWRR